MKLIIWLWNPWKEYEKTRHNLWFIFLNIFAGKNWFPEFQLESKFKAEISSKILKWEKTILLKPQTYMNLSWDSIKKIINFYKIDLKDIIVIYDDLSMDFSKVRFRDKWSAWWHNWIKSIIQHLSDWFKRIKVWIWYNSKYEVSDWVLSKFTQEELIDLDNEIYDKIYEILFEKI